METTELLFTIANTAILLAWLPLLAAPKWSLTQQMLAIPFVPFVLSFFYLFFLLFFDIMIVGDCHINQQA